MNLKFADGKQVSNIRRIVYNSGWLICEQMLRMLFGFFIGAWVARYLGPDEFGVLTFLQAFISLFTIIGTLGLNRIVVRELVVVQDNAQQSLSLLTTAFFLRITAAVVLFALCLILGFSFGQSRPLYISIIACSIFFNACETTFELAFQARTFMRPVVIARAVVFFVSAAIKIGLLLANAGLTAFVLMCLIDVAFSACAVVLAYVMNFRAPRLKYFDWEMARNMLRESWSEIIAGFSNMLFMRVAQIMLANMSSVESVGIYAAAVKLAEIWYFLPVVLVSSAFPTIVKSRSIDEKAYWRNLGRLLNFLAAGTYVVLLLVLLWASDIIHMVYGASYAASVQVLYIHVWCGLLVCFAQVSGAWLISEKLTSINLMRNILGAAVNLVVNFLVIPGYGAMGASCSALISFFIAFFAFDFFHPKMRKMGIMKAKSLLLMA